MEDAELLVKGIFFGSAVMIFLIWYLGIQE